MAREGCQKDSVPTFSSFSLNFVPGTILVPRDLKMRMAQSLPSSNFWLSLSERPMNASELGIGQMAAKARKKLLPEQKLTILIFTHEAVNIISPGVVSF